MAFGRNINRQREGSSSGEVQQTQNQAPNEDFIDLEDENQPKENNTNQGSHSQVNKKPLLDEVTMIDAQKGKNAGGTKRWRCNHCYKSYSSSYTRIHHHFFGPPAGVKAEIGRCTTMLTNRRLLQELNKKVQEAEKTGISPSLTRSTVNSKNLGTSKNPIEKAFGIVERHDVDIAIVRFLCANGIPFNVLRSPEMAAMTNALKNAPKDYKPPSADRARTSLLDDLKREVERECTPISDTWSTQGTSIISDGWTNIKKNPLINVIAANSRGSMFLYAEDFAGVEKTGKEIANFLLKAIDEVGSSNVMQVVTDNAANCKAAGKEVEKVHKHIFWSPCVVHTLNLIFKDFAVAFPWMSVTYIKGKNIVKYFINHTHAHTIFRNHSGLELLKVAKTREMGREVTDTIKSEEFWDEVDNILAITKPLYRMIRFADGEGQKMGEIYEKMDCMIGEISEVMKNNKRECDHEKMNEIMVTRWEKMNIPMHCLGFALNPCYYDNNYLQSPAPGGEPRRAPNCDLEVVQGVLEAFDKIGENEGERMVYRHQLAKFQGKQGMFGSLAAKIDAVTMSPISWWSTYGAETPELSEVAIKVLSQPISSSSAERVWSTYSYIHSVKRNRLNSVRADKLVYIHSNIRLISRFTSGYNDGPYKRWDIDPDLSYLDDSMAKLDELRWKEDGIEEENVVPAASKRQRYEE
ncbi:hypothetical protein OROMI_021062 [Orobanche minor]